MNKHHPSLHLIQRVQEAKPVEIPGKVMQKYDEGVEADKRQIDADAARALNEASKVRLY